MAYDSDWDKVSLLMHFDGDNGSTAFANEVSGMLADPYGNAQLSTTQKRFGLSSAYFDGTGDYISMPHSTALYDPGSSDWTGECWLYCTAYYPAADSSSIIFGTYSYGSVEGGTQNAGWELGISSQTGIIFCGFGNGGSWTTVVNTGVALPLNVWVHLALVKLGDQYTFYLNGTSIGTASYSTPVTYAKTKFKIGGAMGSDGNHYYFYNGYIDELRITKGLARYTSNFTPATQKFPYPIPDRYWANDVLLMHFNGDNNSTVFTDELRNAVTVGGNTNISTSQSKFGGSSAYFDGTGDYLSLQNPGSLSLGSDNFTIECWIYLTSFQRTPYYGYYFTVICSIDGNGSNQRSYTFHLKGTSNSFDGLGFTGFEGDGTYTEISSDFSFSLNQWYHIAATRYGNNIYLFVNGSQVNTATAFSRTMQNSNQPFTIGCDYYGGVVYPFEGFIDNLRITMRVARYTGAFEPPASALVSDANTSLLLDFAGADNSTTFTDISGNPKTITPSGNAKISTAQFKFGGSSGYFDGTGDYLSTPNATDFDLGSSDFTIECWIYPTSIPSLGHIVGKWYTTATSSWLLYVNAPGYIGASYSSNGNWQETNYLQSSSSTVTLNTWAHVAWVRSGSKMKVFYNGVLVASGTFSDSIFNTTNDVTIGGNLWNQFFNGYIDDLRVTKGIARYTVDFTPPDREFYYPYVPYWESDSLLMHFDGDNNSTTFYNDVDQSTATVTGNAKISTTQSKFGGSSGYFDGVSDVLRFYSSRVPLYTNDFTIEAFINLDLNAMNTIGVGAWERLIQIGAGDQDATNGVFNIVRYGNSIPMGVQIEYYNVGWVTLLQITNCGINANTWYHFAVTRKSGTFRVFVDGVLKGTNTPASANLYHRVITIGCGGANTYCIKGYIDELRISNGVARYTADFVVPTKSYPKAPAPFDNLIIDNEGFDYLGDTSAKNILSSDNIYYRELTPFDDYGTASIEGIVTIKGAPVSTEVFLFTLADKRLIATTMSNALGEYSFTNLKNQPYFVWARDETEVYNPVSRIAQNTL